MIFVIYVVGGKYMAEEKGKGTCKIIIEKYKTPDPKKIKELKPYEVIEEKLPFELEDVFLAQGVNAIWTLVCGGAETPFNNTNAHICVGDGSDAEDDSQTGPQGSNYTYLPMDDGYPQYGSDKKAVFKATADGDTANHGWKEFLVANGSSTSAKHINRKVNDKGTKPSGETWVITVELSIS